MGSKLAFCAMFVLFMVLVALVTVLALVWTMPDLPKTVRMRNSICLPSEQGFLRCGKTTDLMHDYLQMRWMFSVTVLMIFRLADSNHMLQDGSAVGRWVNVQDSVIQSCKGHFLCEVFPYHNSLGLTCLHARHVCDGIQHCRDGSDELPSQCDNFRGDGGGGLGSGVVIHGGGGGGGGDYDIIQDGGGPNEQVIYEDVGRQGGPPTQVVYQDVGSQGGIGLNDYGGGGGGGGGGGVKKDGANHIQIGNTGHKNHKKSSPQVIIIQQPPAAKKSHNNIASLLKLMRGMGGMRMGKKNARMGGMMSPFGKFGGGGIGMAALAGGGFGRGFGGGGFGRGFGGGREFGDDGFGRGFGGFGGGGGLNALRLAEILDR